MDKCAKNNKKTKEENQNCCFISETKEFKNSWGGFKDPWTKFKTNWCKDTNTVKMRTNWADVNGDGKYDMICDKNNGDHDMAFSKGDGSFNYIDGIVKNWCKETPTIKMKTNWADVNGDGKADMICD